MQLSPRVSDWDEGESCILHPDPTKEEREVIMLLDSGR